MVPVIGVSPLVTPGCSGYLYSHERLELTNTIEPSASIFVSMFTRKSLGYKVPFPFIVLQAIKALTPTLERYLNSYKFKSH